MSLTLILTIVRRWWWLAVLPAVVIGALGLLTFRLPPTGYGTSIRLTAGAPPVDPNASGYDPLYHSWLTSEYIVASLSDWVRTGEFAAAVSAELAAQGVELPPAAVQGALASDYLRSTLVLYVSGGDPTTVQAIATAAVTVLQTQNAAVFPPLGGTNAIVTPLDSPTVGANPPGLRAYVELVIRLSIGAVLGLGLMLAAHYLDPFVRSKDDLTTDWPVLGQIPRER